MSNEVKRYCCFDPFNGSEELFGEYQVVLASDYAALEAERDELQRRLDAADEWATMASEQLKERDALRTQLEAIRAAGGESGEDRHEKVKAIHDIMAAVHCSSLYSLAEAVHDAGYGIVAAMAAELERAKSRVAELEIENLPLSMLRTSYQVHKALVEAAGCETIEQLAEQRDAALSELEAARKQEPVGHQYQNREGEWCNFMDQRHYENTLEDGTWPIRAIFTLPPLAGQVSVPRELLRRVCWPVVSGSDRHTHSEAVAELRALLATPSMEVKHDA